MVGDRLGSWQVVGDRLRVVDANADRSPLLEFAIVDRLWTGQRRERMLAPSRVRGFEAQQM